MASSSTYAFFHCHYSFQKFPFFCVTLYVLHALQNATLSHSAEHATHATAGSSMRNTNIRRAHCCLSVTTFSVFNYVADSVICTSTVQRERYCCVFVATVVTQNHHNFASYVYCLYSFNNIVVRFYKF